jgi:hypothetical protein
MIDDFIAAPVVEDIKGRHWAKVAWRQHAGAPTPRKPDDMAIRSDQGGGPKRGGFPAALAGDF